MGIFTRGKRRQRASTQMDPQLESENPFIVSIKIPVNETDEERIRRARALQDAQRISKQIDESLQETKKMVDRRKRAVKILLLGQAESGKSAVLKNFQLAFTPKQFEREKGVWRTVIQLNLINSIKTILNVLNEGDPLTPPTTPCNPSKSHRRLHLSLSPLLSMETDLNKLIFTNRAGSREICVQAGGGWKAKLGFKDSARGSSEFDNLTNAQTATKNDFVKLLEASKEEISALWADPGVQQILEDRGVVLRDTPGFFLDDIERVASSSYQPTDVDIVRARLRTVGVEEHHLIPESVVTGYEFFITDVSGMRSSRNSWIPFFDDAQAILFLVPLAFNQMLEEDHRVNRLEDSLMLWKEICSNVLLADCNIIIFFNKMDILRRTLKSGVEVRRFVPSYGDAPNDVPTVTKYFKDRFKTYHKKLSPKPRTFISHETSAIDIRSTTALVVAVHEGIIRHNLQKSDML